MKNKNYLVKIICIILVCSMSVCFSAKAWCMTPAEELYNQAMRMSMSKNYSEDMIEYFNEIFQKHQNDQWLQEPSHLFLARYNHGVACYKFGFDSDATNNSN